MITIYKLCRHINPVVLLDNHTSSLGASPFKRSQKQVTQQKSLRVQRLSQDIVTLAGFSSWVTRQSHSTSHFSPKSYFYNTQKCLIKCTKTNIWYLRLCISKPLHLDIFFTPMSYQHTYPSLSCQ